MSTPSSISPKWRNSTSSIDIKNKFSNYERIIAISEENLSLGLALCLMDFPKPVDTINMGLSILYFEGSQVEFSQCRPSVMQLNAAFRLCLHCLPKYMLRGFHYTNGQTGKSQMICKVKICTIATIGMLNIFMYYFPT